MRKNTVSIIVLVLMSLVMIRCGSPATELVNREILESLGEVPMNEFLAGTEEFRKMTTTDPGNAEAFTGLADMKVLLYVLIQNKK